jgi:uncharacterized protein (DUF1697 family)
VSRQLAFLRAFNVGGRRATSAQLADASERAGALAVATHLASGNVSFVLPDGVAAADMEERLERAYEKAFGFASPTLVREVDAVASALAASGFGPVKPTGDHRHLMVAVRPQQWDDVFPVALPRGAGTLLGVHEGLVFVDFSVGARVPNPAQEIERAYGCVATGRFGHTLHRIVAAAASA